MSDEKVGKPQPSADETSPNYSPNYDPLWDKPLPEDGTYHPTDASEVTVKSGTVAVRFTKDLLSKKMGEKRAQEIRAAKDRPIKPRYVKAPGYDNVGGAYLAAPMSEGSITPPSYLQERDYAEAANLGRPRLRTDAKNLANTPDLDLPLSVNASAGPGRELMRRTWWLTSEGRAEFGRLLVFRRWRWQYKLALRIGDLTAWYRAHILLPYHFKLKPHLLQRMGWRTYARWLWRHVRPAPLREVEWPGVPKIEEGYLAGGEVHRHSSLQRTLDKGHELGLGTRMIVQAWLSAHVPRTQMIDRLDAYLKTLPAEDRDEVLAYIEKHLREHGVKAVTVILDGLEKVRVEYQMKQDALESNPDSIHSKA